MDVHDGAGRRRGGLLTGIRGGVGPPRANEDPLRNLRNLDADYGFSRVVVDSHRCLVCSMTSGLGCPAVSARRSPIGQQPAAVRFVSPCPSRCKRLTRVIALAHSAIHSDRFVGSGPWREVARRAICGRGAESTSTGDTRNIGDRLPDGLLYSKTRVNHHGFLAARQLGPQTVDSPCSSAGRRGSVAGFVATHLGGHRGGQARRRGGSLGARIGAGSPRGSTPERRHLGGSRAR